MGKKKKKAPPKVWCFYCEREFDDEKILIQHQKAKHFKCHVCHKKLSTAGGLVIHVLQVHKQAITKVPNAKPERESTELEIFGMEGIPPEILAAHEGDQDDEKPAKSAKLEIPSFASGAAVGVSPLPPQPLYRPMVPMYVPPRAGALQPSGWPPQPPATQAWAAGYAYARPAVAAPRPPMPVPQPLFPIQGANISSAPTYPQPPPPPPPPPLFPISSSSSQVAASVHPLPPSHAFASSGAPPGVQMPVAPVSQPSPSANVNETRQIDGSGSALGQGVTSSSPNPQAVSGGVTAPSVSGQHSYAAAPNTGAACIGPPPVIANKAPGQATANEVYLVWDDEAMSMEERRLLLPRYQVHDEAFQMNSVDAAIDKRILESRLASRMSFGV